MSRKTLLIILVVAVSASLIIFKIKPTLNIVQPKIIKEEFEVNPLMVSQMQKKEYSGSDLIIEQALEDGINYHQYIASYYSEGLKIFGLLTVPVDSFIEGGWPVIIFNHGYISPEVYKTNERYTSYVDYFARNGYVVFKSDYRGHGFSEGQPQGAYYSPAYTTDVLNALSSIKKYPGVNSNKIGMWGHSMGGNLTLRSMVINSNIKAGVIWAGVVGSYDALMNNWHRRAPFQPSPEEWTFRSRYRMELLNKYGSPSANPKFWNSIDPTANLDKIFSPLQLHHGLEDDEVPWQFSKDLSDKLKSMGKEVEYYEYEGADHNISAPYFEVAMQRSLEFFNRYLK